MRPIPLAYLFLGLQLFCISPSHASKLKSPKLEKQAPPSCRQFVEMGTIFNVCLYPPQKLKKNLEMHFEKAQTILADINQWMSDWLPASELSQINEFAGIKAVPVRKDLF